MIKTPIFSDLGTLTTSSATVKKQFPFYCTRPKLPKKGGLRGGKLAECPATPHERNRSVTGVLKYPHHWPGRNSLGTCQLKQDG
ncbi:hypothetical protein PoB_000157400 [Plakobranchus ocellatus]|uniref:Uncharacterized protein n=1 Tax=Plakobranchus ocellatus TaxID=259542 RepID=A0AAV3XZB4_9GAST|nr:hypothetical protein PoB_000157400 [Plakobranchus ocellatus]